MLCPCCNRQELEVFFDRRAAPVLCNVLWPTRDEALAAPMGEIRLGFCGHCGMIFNVAFDPEQIQYDQAYENSLHFSPRFQDYAETLASSLVERHGLRSKSVIDIGCGKGDFLKLICRIGDNRGIGFDTSYEGETQDGPITFIRDFYSEAHGHLNADLISCRHVLEHIPQPIPFLEGLRKAAASNPAAAIFFEVPHVLWTLRDLGIWDIIYEHCSYFSAPALEQVFEASGFRPQRTYAAFGEQFLCLEAGLSNNGSGTTKKEPNSEQVAELRQLVDRFAEHFRTKVAHWDQRLAELSANDQRVAIWGAGSKGVTFLNTVSGGASVDCAVDINPRKQGRYLPGSGQQVVSPQTLADRGVDVVLIMNALYRDEIATQLTELGVDAQLDAV